MLNVFLVLYVTQTLSKGTINVAIGTVPLYKCTERSPSLFWPSYVVRYLCGREKKYRNVPLHQIYPVTKFDGRAAYSLRSTSSQRLFHTFNTVILYSRLIWACLPILLQAPWHRYICDIPDARVEHVGA